MVLYKYLSFKTLKEQTTMVAKPVSDRLSLSISNNFVPYIHVRLLLGLAIPILFKWKKKLYFMIFDISLIQLCFLAGLCLKERKEEKRSKNQASLPCQCKLPPTTRCTFKKKKKRSAKRKSFSMNEVKFEEEKLIKNRWLCIRRYKGKCWFMDSNVVVICRSD